MSTNKVNVDGVMLFEQPFVRVRQTDLGSRHHSHQDACQVPYENYRKVFRASQRNIERELGNVQTTSNDLQKRTKSNEVDLEDATKAVDGMITRVENLKRKVGTSCIVPAS